MEGQVKRDLIAVLENGLQPNGIPLQCEGNYDARCRAESSGWLCSINNGQLYTTPEGMRAIKWLKHPVRFWVRENWFPVTIALITAGAAVAGVVVDILK